MRTMKNPHLFKNGENFVASMKELIKHYQGAIKLKMSKREYERHIKAPCLLCNPLNSIENHDSIEKAVIAEFDEAGCDSNTFYTACERLGCPWMVIVGMSCSDYSRVYLRNKGSDYYNLVYATDDARIMKNRIRQLRHWIKTYQNKLATTI